MGICLSGGQGVDPESLKKDRLISKNIKSDARKFESEIRLLLLGSGESGKSTIAKQMKIIHMHGFTNEELLEFKGLIYANTFNGIVILLKNSIEFGYKLEKKNKDLVDLFLNEESEYFSGTITSEMAANIDSLWKDPAIIKTFDRKGEYQLSDAVPYYLDNVLRLGAPDYVPSEQDVLRSRSKTTGIIETEFNVEGIHFRMVDVGGQRSERKKWMNCFQDVTAIIFCVALSEYDLKLEEDERVNRMSESLQLFGQICNSKWFVGTSIILFLNKSDIFKNKLNSVPMSVCFPDYNGPQNDWMAAANFIGEKFVAQCLNKNKKIYIHVTCATDTSNVKFVFNAVKDIILQQALEATGINF